MKSNVQPIPEGYHSITPYLIVHNGNKAIEFYKKAFGAEELYRIPDANNKVAHAELQIGDSRIMLSDESPSRKTLSPKSVGSSPVIIMLYVEDVDATFEKAVSAGAKALQALENKFYGDRTGSVLDPFGHLWFLATHVEDVSPEEIQQRSMASH